MESFQERMGAVEQSETARAAALKQRFEEVENKVKDQSNTFESEMASAGQMLASLVSKDHYGMNQVIDQMDSLTKSTKDQTTAEITTAQSRLEAMTKAAKDAADLVHSKTSETSKDVEAFETKMDAVEDSHEQTMAELEEQQEDFREAAMSTGRRFTGRVAHETLARKNQTDTLQDQANETTHKLLHTLDLVRMMGAKVTGRVQWQLGTLDLDDQKMNRTLREAELLEEYNDAKAINNVKAKAKLAWKKENEIKAWKKEEQKRMRKFRSLVEEELGKLGEELDMSAVELAEEKAAEEYHEREALSHLHETLGDEVHQLSATSKARLNDLSADMGQEIADVMKRKDLSAHERSEMMAQIKADGDQRAKDILDENGRLELEAKTAARNLKVRTDQTTAAAEEDEELSNRLEKLAERLKRKH